MQSSSRFLLFIFLIAFCLALTRCGNDYCIMGIGPCNNLPDFDINSSGSSNGLILDGDLSIRVSETTTLTARGGTSPYQYLFVNQSSSTGSISATSGASTVYTAASTVPSNMPQIRLTDNDGNSYTVTINITD